MTASSGTQYRLSNDTAKVQIASVGATLRQYRHGGRDLVVPFEADEVRPLYRGATLAPWPNRVVDGRYSLDGQEYQLGLNEVAHGHALHGLVAWLDFQLVDQSSDSVTLAATVEPQTGYPWRIAIETTFTLTDQGLSQEVRATNLSATPAPFGAAPHPYLMAEGPLDEWTLELPAGKVLLTDDRLSPTDLVEVTVDADRFDFRTARRIGNTAVDHAFTDLTRDAEGHATVRVIAPTGRGVAMTWDARCPWVQVHTADLPAGNPSHRIGLAVEPMTCAPNAFNSHSGLIVLGP